MLGLREKEVDIFMTLLRLGCQPASVVARYADTNRATTYAVLDVLAERGLVSKIMKGRFLHFTAVSPEKVLVTMRNKRRELELQERELSSLLPTLTRLMAAGSDSISKPKIRYYEGAEGVKTAMEETFTATEPLLCYCSLQKWFNGPLASYAEDYVRRRINMFKIPNRVLEEDTPEAREFFMREFPQPLTDHRFLPVGAKWSSSEMNIFNDKVAIVSLRPGHMFGVVIESAEFAETQKAIFEVAWLACDSRVPKSKKTTVNVKTVGAGGGIL